MILVTRDILLVNLGTHTPHIAIKSLTLQGEVITTLFSHAANTSSILWENCKVNFVGITGDYLTIDEEKIEKTQSDRTSPFLATNVFDIPYNGTQIRKVARKHNLEVNSIRFKKSNK